MCHRARSARLNTLQRLHAGVNVAQLYRLRSTRGRGWVSARARRRGSHRSGLRSSTKEGRRRRRGCFGVQQSGVNELSGEREVGLASSRWIGAGAGGWPLVLHAGIRVQRRWGSARRPRTSERPECSAYLRCPSASATGCSCMESAPCYEYVRYTPSIGECLDAPLREALHIL